LIPSWLVWAEIECTVHVSLLKRPTKPFKPVQQSVQQVLRAYCPNIYTVVKVLEKDTSMSSALESFIKEIIINVKLVHCKMSVWLKLVVPDTNFQPIKTFKLLAQD
jgi:hypothetical protein